MAEARVYCMAVMEARFCMAEFRLCMAEVRLCMAEAHGDRGFPLHSVYSELLIINTIRAVSPNLI